MSKGLRSGYCDGDRLGGTPFFYQGRKLEVNAGREVLPTLRDRGHEGKEFPKIGLAFAWNKPTLKDTT
jgi:hypothetical protein